VQTASVYAFRTQIGQLEPDRSHAVDIEINPTRPRRLHVARTRGKVKDFLVTPFAAASSGPANSTGKREVSVI
jgi:hypothetical protein